MLLMSLERLLHCIGGLNQGLRGWHEGIGHVTNESSHLNSVLDSLVRACQFYKDFKINEKT